MQKQRGFTLIELMVVISIISMLSSVVIASVQSAREKAKTAAGKTFATHTYRAFGADAIVHWDFNEASGNAIDQSGNNRTGILTNAVSRSTDTPSNGNSGSFDGGFYSSAIFNEISLDRHTASVWIKPSSGYGGSPLFCGYSSATADSIPGARRTINLHMVRYSSNDYRIIYGHLDDVNSWGPSLDGGYVRTPIEDNKWAHVAYTWNGSQEVLYVNGKEIFRATRTPKNLTLERVSFGTYVFSPGQVYRGLADDFVIYPYTLLASEIENIYAQGAVEKGLAVK